MTLDTGTYLSALAADSEALADLAESNLDRPVPSCPGWTVADVVGHLGGVYSWVGLVVQAAGERPNRDRERPPSERDALVAWFRDRRNEAVAALSSRPPEEHLWIFYSRDGGSVGEWCRRQAVETAVHLHDGELATGHPGRIGPDLASDGIDEYLATFLPWHLRRVQVAGLTGTFHVHCTDAAGEWLVDFEHPGLDVRREHAKADTAVRGPASDLFLWLWNRRPLDGAGVELFGRRDVAEALAGVKL